MDPELRRALEEVHALTRDNHRLLRAVRRHQLLEMFGRYAFWLIVIGGTYYGYVAYFMPLAQKYATLHPTTSSAVQNVVNSVTGQ